MKRSKTQGLKVKTQWLKLNAVFCVLFTVLVLSGCVSTTDFETVRGDASQSRKELFELKKEVNDLKAKTANVIKEDDFRAFRENQGDLQSRISETEKNLQVLSGKFDENKYSIEKTLKESASEMTLIKAQIANVEDQIKQIKNKLNAAMEGQQTVGRKETEEPKRESPQEQAQKPVKQAVSKDKVSLYEEAYDAFKDKKYKGAREKFETFMKEFPQDELADNAQFWIAETYYGEKDFEAAILAYETVLKKYPKSEKAVGALLKQGFSFIELGDKKTGKTILDKVMELYPASREAELAKKKIDEIEKGSSKKKK
jgi:tol-pal system protein YbgF